MKKRDREVYVHQDLVRVDRSREKDQEVRDTEKRYREEEQRRKQAQHAERHNPHGTKGTK